MVGGSVIPLVGTDDGKGVTGAEEIGPVVGWGRGVGAVELVGAKETVATTVGPSVNVGSELPLDEGFGEIVVVGSKVADTVGLIVAMEG